MLEIIPPWAKCLSDGTYMEIGAQLTTRDGRRTGNAFVDSIKEVEGMGKVADVVTDAGNRMQMILLEMEHHFYPPKYVMEIYGARAKFCNAHTRVVCEAASDYKLATEDAMFAEEFGGISKLKETLFEAVMKWEYKDE